MKFGAHGILLVPNLPTAHMYPSDRPSAPSPPPPASKLSERESVKTRTIHVYFAAPKASYLSKRDLCQRSRVHEFRMNPIAPLSRTDSTLRTTRRTSCSKATETSCTTLGGITAPSPGTTATPLMHLPAAHAYVLRCSCKTGILKN